MKAEGYLNRQDYIQYGMSLSQTLQFPIIVHNSDFSKCA